ncbi:carboxymuconolactone decarboxylase family protein [Paenibacillus sp.]|uniref:carboxymuconolactone decarboxylase family protein n=1 Tax=Paenibacillus sp. TaxID=58172 RepID=UPI002D67C7C5|nr:carboxymuconolactone decarboxylase family protein [Paenibacillus sp.]HZG85640.1 carboxymuconolactone decarboxylase family protein [Paenibacillus sp.]
MKLRMNYREASPAAFQAMLQLEGFVTRSGLERSVRELIRLRVSQLNGCSFCVDLHSREMLAHEPPERVYLLPVWREAPCYTDRERAALAFAEAVAFISERGVPEEVFEEMRKHYDEAGIVHCIMAVNAINAWNRLAIATGMYPGAMEPASKE